MEISVESMIARYRILPVVSISDASSSHPLAEALVNGGLPVAEITLRTDCALSVIESLAGRSDFLVGAGTVLNAEQCERAIGAGTRFVVSPGFDEGVLDTCRAANVPYFGGVATATELQRAMNFGVRTVKFFPAESLGGVRMLEALSAPFPEMKFIPTGGINLDNMAEYLKLSATLAVGGSWMVSKSLYEDGDFTRVTTAVQAAMKQHVGV